VISFYVSAEGGDDGLIELWRAVDGILEPLRELCDEGNSIGEVQHED
jgi:hypothetical protein